MEYSNKNIFDMLNKKAFEYLDSYTDLNEEMLTENRIQFLKDTTKELDTSHDTTAEHRDTPSIIQHLADNADPTKNKAHTQYAVGLYKAKAIRQEDAPRLKAALENFDKYKGKLNPEDKQLTVKKYPTISSIEDKIEPHLGTMTSKKEAERTLDQPGHRLVYDDKDISVYHLTDKDASKALYGGGYQRGGTGTTWCTAARSDDNRFDHYHAQGPFHVIHDKKTGEVYQMHPESNQFKDKKDNEITPTQFASIQKPFHKFLEKHEAEI